RIFRCHSDGRLDVRQAASTSRSQDSRSRCLLVREFTNGQPIMVPECQVPPDELTSYALEEFGNGFLAIFWLSQHTLDSVCSVTPTRDVDRHGISPEIALLALVCGRRALPPSRALPQQVTISGKNSFQLSPCRHRRSEIRFIRPRDI